MCNIDRKKNSCSTPITKHKFRNMTFTLITHLVFGFQIIINIRAENITYEGMSYTIRILNKQKFIEYTIILIN